MKCLWILILCLALVACTSPAPQASPLETRVVVPSQPAPTVTGELAVQPQPKDQPTALPSTGTETEAPCSSAMLESLAPVLLDMKGQPGAQLTLVDLANGLPSCQHEPLQLERYNHLAVSPDGQRLAAVTTDSEQFYRSQLLLVDLVSGKVYPTPTKIDSWISAMVFSPDGSRVALAYPKEPTGVISKGETTYTLLVASFGDQDEVVETTLPYAVRLVRFTGDGSALVVYGAPDTSPDGDYPVPTAALLDASDLSRIWEQRLDQVQHGSVAMEGTTGDLHLMQYLEPAVVYAPQQDSLYIVHASEAVLTQVNFTDRTVSSLEIRPRLSWIERFLALFAETAQAKGGSGVRKQAVLSPKGDKLYVIATREDMKIEDNGSITPQREPLGLQVLDPHSGQELGRFETTADEVRLSPDGTALLLTTWDWSQIGAKAEVVSIKDLAVRASYDDRQFLVTVSPAGNPLLLLVKYGSKQTEFTLLDGTSYQPVGVWQAEKYPGLVGLP